MGTTDSTTSLTALIQTQNSGSGQFEPGGPQQENFSRAQQTLQARGAGERVSRKPKEERLTKAHSFNGDLRDLPYRKPVKRERPEHEDPDSNPTMYPGTFAPTVPGGPSAVTLPTLSAPAPPPASNFDGLDFATFGAGHPPDTNGDVGPTYYIQTVNTAIGIFRKSDGVRVAAFTFNTFMSQGNFGNLCDTNNFGDPVVLYDSFEDRWIITDFAFSLDGSNNVINPPGAFQCFAASKTGDPVSGGWNFYSINTEGGLGDYPKFGIWPDGLYMSVNMFDYAAAGSFQNPRVYAFNKAQMYAGAPSVQSVSFNVSAADFTVLPSNARLQTGTPPPGTPNYFVSTWQFLNALSVYKFHVDWNRISLSTFTGPDVPLAATSWPNAAVPNAPSLGGNSLDVLQIRAMMQNQYTNIGGAESLWTTHTVRRGNTTGFGAPRWYQANVTSGVVAANLPQATTWDPDGANVIYRFMPSLAVDRMGDMALGYSTSSSTTKPAIKYAGRLVTDPVNTFSQTEQLLIQGLGTQTGSCGGTCSRWGDYSAMSLDPDGCTFWYTNEYYNADGLNNLTRIGSFSYPQCTPVGAGGTLSGTVTDSVTTIPINGATVALGSRTTTTDVNGAYNFFDLPAGTYPGVTASFAGYGSSTAASIIVADAMTTTQNFSLTAGPITDCLVDTSQADFQTGLATNVDLNTSSGDVTLLDAPNVDQQNLSVTSSGFGVNSTAWAGQTFTAGLTGLLTRVDLDLFCSGCTGTTPNLTVSIRATTGSPAVPTGADLAVATIPGFNSGAGGFFTANFSTPATVTTGTRYAVIIRASANPSAGTYAYVVSSANPYANGQRVTSGNSGATWTADVTSGGRDLGFIVYVKTGFAASGNLVSGTKDANPAMGLVPRWTTLSWTASTPANTSVQFQAAASNNIDGPFDFVGPDGTAGTFFTTSGASLAQFNGFHYLKYKALLTTTDGTMTPTLNDVTVCFDNDTPAITAAAPLSRQQGATANSQIATVSDPVQAANTLLVTATPLTGTGVTVNNINIDGSGNVTADVAASCAATDSTFTLTVTNSGGGSATATLTVNVIATPTPTITPEGPTTFFVGGSVTLTSSSVSGNQWYLNNSPIGGATAQQYVATASGDYTVTVTINGCTSAPSAPVTVTVNTIPLDPPTTTKAFAPAVIARNGLTTLSIVITNPASNAASLDGVSFTDNFPANLVVASPSGLGNTCGGTATAIVGLGTLSLTGGSIPSNSSCTIGVNVTSSIPGTYTNDTGPVSSTNGGTGESATATLAVAVPPTISKLFLPDTVETNGTTLLSFTISNPNSDPNANVTLTGIAFTDNLPAGLVVASPNELSSNCGGIVTATPGSSTISLSGGALAPPPADLLRGAQSKIQALDIPAPGACFISVKVQASGTVGTRINTTGPISANESGPGDTSNTASLTVAAPPEPPTIDKNFGDATIPLNGTTALLFTLANPNSNLTLMNVSASDTLPAGLVVASLNGLAGTCVADVTATPGSNVIGITALNLAASDSCFFSVNVTGTGAGTKLNVSGNVTATYDGGAGNFIQLIGGSATATLEVLKGNQTITFGSLTNKTFGDADFTVSATASSGLPVSLMAAGNCTVTSPSPGTVHLLGAGSCTITASQAGDSNYNAAASVPQSFDISQAATATALSSSINPSDIGQNVIFTATVTSSITPTGTVQFKDGVNDLGGAVNCAAGLGNTCTAQVSTSTLPTGTHAISATYSGDSNFIGSSGLLSGGQEVTNQPALFLILEEMGPDPNQAVALDSLLLVRDPFQVLSIADWLSFGPDRNTRVTVFVANLQLNQGETSSAVVVNLIDSNNQSYDVPAEDVRLDLITGFAQVSFRLPDTLSPGVCVVQVKAHGQVSNSATIHIGP